VPEVGGKVVFETVIKAPGKSQKQIYDLLLEDFTRMTKEPNQFEQSRVVISDDNNYSQLVGNFQEWLVFKNRPLVLDRTRMFYHLMANIKDGEADIKMTRIYYLYDEEREPTTYKAEEWITDKYAVNKKHTKLYPVSAKFRRKTIDRKDFIFNKFTTLLNEK
jgi:colicin import membrane protein